MIPSALRLVLDEEGAAALRKDEIRAEFALNNKQFAELRRELGRMLTDLGVYREKIEEPTSRPTPAPGR